MYKQIEFEEFIINLVEYYPNKGFLTIDKLIGGLTQFDMSVHEYLNTSRFNVSVQCRTIFSKTLLNKPSAVHIRNWFLFLFGFKHCSNCNTILLLSEFHNDSKFWCKVRRWCKKCCNSDSINDYMKNPENSNIRASKHRANQSKAIPPWFNEIHRLEFIKLEIKRKILEKENNIKFHKDHIVPLQNDIICGLHLPINIQIISASENYSKNNKFNQEEFSNFAFQELKQLGL